MNKTTIALVYILARPTQINATLDGLSFEGCAYNDEDALRLTNYNVRQRPAENVVEFVPEEAGALVVEEVSEFFNQEPMALEEVLIRENCLEVRYSNDYITPADIERAVEIAFRYGATVGLHKEVGLLDMCSKRLVAEVIRRIALMGV